MQRFDPFTTTEEKLRVQREVYRYLGYRKDLPDPDIRKVIDDCLDELVRVMTPGYIRKTVQVRLLPDDALEIEGVTVHSKNLSKNLRGCEQICLMAATIGIGVDRMIARASVSQMSRAVIYQAAGAALIEELCDRINMKIREEAAEKGLYCRPRFSPGYGDLPLEFQRDLFRILNISKEIGVSLTDSLLMMPTKSVTAIIGLSESNENCHVHGCEVCKMADHCAFRRA